MGTEQATTAGSAFGRDGHLTALGAERFSLGELVGAERARVEEHLGGCAACSARCSARARFDEGLALPPLRLGGLQAGAVAAPQAGGVAAPQSGGKVIAFPGRAWVGGVVGFALAAGLAGLLWPGSQEAAREGLGAEPSTGVDGYEEGVRRKGQEFAFEVFVDAPTGARPVATGEAVEAGARVGFRVHPRSSGHLLIVGVDEQGNDYLCFPQKGGGGSASWEASERARAVEEAVRFDAVPGREHLVALYCERPISWEEVKGGLKEAQGGQALPALRGDCVQREVILNKAAPQGGDGGGLDASGGGGGP
jgi:hypothetical protein